MNLSRFPVLAVAISGNLEDRVIQKYSKYLKRKIESFSEVLEVTTLGESEREVKIIVNPDIVRNYGLTNKDVLASIAKSNLMIPAGTLSNEKEVLI